MIVRCNVLCIWCNYWTIKSRTDRRIIVFCRTFVVRVSLEIHTKEESSYSFCIFVRHRYRFRDFEITSSGHQIYKRSERNFKNIFRQTECLLLILKCWYRCATCTKIFSYWTSQRNCFSLLSLLKVNQNEKKKKTILRKQRASNTHKTRYFSRRTVRTQKKIIKRVESTIGRDLITWQHGETEMRLRWNGC